MKSYRFVDGLYRAELIRKKSRFIATAAGETDAAGAAEFIRRIKREFPDARHNCYAYIGSENETGYSDDGEPSGTAGMPIYNVILKQRLKMTAVVVTRYFGGIKLGTGGLASAYSDVTAAALEKAVIGERKESRKISLTTDYSVYPSLETYLKSIDGIKEQTTEFSDRVKASFFVPLESEAGVIEKIRDLTNGAASAEILETAFK